MMDPKAKRPRTIGRFSKEMHAKAQAKGYALMHVELNDAYLPGEGGSNFSSHGACSPALAEAIKDVMCRYWKGELK